MKKFILIVTFVLSMMLCYVVEADADDWLWPVEGYYHITSNYGQRGSEFHKGVDVSSSGISGKPVRAMRSGYATVYPNNASAGNYVSINHGDGYVSRYLHMSGFAISSGYVEKGQVIGYVGNTGNSTGTHLHFDISLSGNYINSMPINSTGVHTYNSGVNSTGAIQYIYELYTQPPTNVALSVDKELYAIGENVTFNCSGTNVQGYTIGITKNGERIYTGDINSVYQTSFSESGVYSAYITAWNDVGSVDSNRVSFNIYNSAPNNVSLSINKSLVAVGEEITFMCEGENVVGYTIGIINGNERVLTQDIGGTFIKSFSKPGEYSAYITAWNDRGMIDSNHVYFVVYNSAPVSSKLSIDKNIVHIGESIRFICESDFAIGYTIGIDKNGTRVYTSEVEPVFSKIFSETGQYTAYITTWNAYGGLDTNVVSFTVFDKKPQIANLEIKKTLFHISEEIEFICTSDYATGFTVGISKDGKRICTEVVSSVFKKTFTEEGKYKAYVSTWNTYGGLDTNFVSFIVYDGEVVFCENENMHLIKEMNTQYNSACKVVGLYSNNKLIDCQVINGTDNIIDFNLKCMNNQPDCIKVMVWDSLSGMKPLCEAEIIPSSEFITG